MSTINSITTTVVSAFQGVGGVGSATPVETPTSTAPAFQETLTTQGRAFALGLGAPRNHGDIEAIFAEIATKFGAEVSKANDFANAAQSALRSTALGAAAGMLAFFATFNTIMISAELNISKQNQTIGEKTQQINGLEAQKAPLVAQRDALINEYNANANQYNWNVGTIAGAQFLLPGVEARRATECAANAGGAACQVLTQDANNLRNQITTLTAQNVTLVNRNNDIVNNLLPPLNSQIAVLQGQINTATAERNSATNSRNQSQNDFNSAQAALNVLSAVIIPFSVALALGQVGASARASFDLGPDQSSFDNAIAQAVNRLADLSDDMGNFSQMRKALMETLPTTSESVGQLVEAPPSQDAAPDAPSNADTSEKPTPLPSMATDDPVPDTQGLTPPAFPPLPPMVEVQPVDTAVTGPSGVADAGQRQTAMEMLRQILANLPLNTDDLLPDPAPATDVPGQVQGAAQKPQNAFDVVRALLENMLPPAVGNAEEVATRAGELAAALTLLRGAFSQVAQSEASQTPQVPGASGRFNLAI